MHSNRLPVCHIGLFDDARNFFISSITGLLERYPTLELPHESTFYTLLIIEKGKGDVVIDNNRKDIDDAQVIIIKPHCITELNIDRKAEGKIICFTENFFSLRYNNNILNQFSFFNGEAHTTIKVLADNLSYINALLSFMCTEYNNTRKVSTNALRSYLNILLIELERIHVPLKTVHTSNPAREKVQHFQKLIAKNFKTNKMPSEYAEMLNLSTNYLNKICKKTLGQTSGDLIRKQLVLEAQRLLHYTNLSISEIAYELGFEHASYFITFFKKGTNQTPEKYRKTRNDE